MKEKNLFVFGYDTIETPISTNGKNLSLYVKEILKKTGASKVRIIAHSQGNLVARSYLQEYSGYKYVDDLTMVAPPNRGVTKCYGMYYYGSPKILNADIFSLCNFQDDALIGLKTTMVYGNAKDESKKKWVQKYAKSVKDMVPYEITSFESPTTPENTFLKSLNNMSSSGYKNFVKNVKVNVIYGNGVSTVIKYEKNLLGPQTTSYNVGDGVVTSDSAVFDANFNYYKYEGGTHSGLIDGKSNMSSFDEIIELLTT